MIKYLDRDEILKIAASLETHHKIFYVFFELTAVALDDDIPTACVIFEKGSSKAQMRLGEKFWNGLTFQEKLFVVLHECLHVLLDHGVRNGHDVPGATPTLVNKAQDITINEMIVELFNFDRDDLRNWRRYCWIETCFKHPQLVQRNETFYYYLEKLIKEDKEGGAPTDPILFDIHGAGSSGDGSGSGSPEAEAREKLAKKIAGGLSSDELEALKKGLPDTCPSAAGTGKGMYDALFEKFKKLPKLNFQKITERLKKTKMRMVDVDSETFVKEDRRFNNVLRRPDMALPGTLEGLKRGKGLIHVNLYMDVSGSCMNYFERFQKISQAFDAERDIFFVEHFIFDTVVERVVAGARVSIGGGTNFEIIEADIQARVKKGERYPDCVIVVTDGEGTSVKPQFSARWIFLLVPPHDRSYVPAPSRSWNVEQIEFSR
jgi:predicted metal-dependent peptidase